MNKPETRNPTSEIWAVACFVAMLAMLAWVLSIDAAPTTQPASRSPDYLNGWVDAGGLMATTQPATQPGTQPTTAPVVLPTVNFASVWPTVLANQTTILPAANYLASGTYTLPAGAIVDGTGSTIVYTEATTMLESFHAVAPGSGVQNFAGVSGKGVFLLADATGWICNGNTFGLVDRACQFNDSAANGTFSYNLCTVENSMAVYGSGDYFDIEYNDFGKSLGEAALRIDVKSKKRANGQWDRPVGGKVKYNKIISHNGYRKPAFELRSADGCIIAFNSISNLQIGQLPTAAATYTLGSAVTGCTILGNTFNDPDAGVNPVYIRQGASGVAVNGNTFGPQVATLGLPAISVDANSNGTTSGNTQTKPIGMPAIKPLVASSQQTRWKGDGTDQTVSQVIFPAPVVSPSNPPTTQPASQPQN